MYLFKENHCSVLLKKSSQLLSIITTKEKFCTPFQSQSYMQSSKTLKESFPVSSFKGMGKD